MPMYLFSSISFLIHRADDVKFKIRTRDFKNPRDKLAAFPPVGYTSICRASASPFCSPNCSSAVSVTLLFIVTVSTVALPGLLVTPPGLCQTSPFTWVWPNESVYWAWALRTEFFCYLFFCYVCYLSQSYDQEQTLWSHFLLEFKCQHPG